MPIKNKLTIIIKSVSSQALLIIFITIITIIVFKNHPTQEQLPPPKEELKIISTNPDPLEGATIVPTGSIEITFNKPVVASEFKHRFDPELENGVEVVAGINNYYGQTFRIFFKKQLKLGSGYTLFILPNTHTENGLNLNKEIIYHFKTISYKGV